MSLRGTKRGSGARGEEAGPSGVSKRRRTEPEDPALWQLRPVSDLKMSSIYNRSTSEAPAELFRKDLISAMKLPDSEPLTSSEYWVIVDTWKQDWERGVQVPVNPDSLPAPIVKIIDNPRPPDFQEFKLPTKYVHLGRDSHYLPDKHHLSATPALAEKACNYDMDATDTAWLKLLNAERARAGASAVSEDQFERVIEQLEVKTWDKIQTIMKSEEGLGIEYDENVICDVCRSPDSEDGNEMVFCDSCNICVHQACYGITVIPDGQWLCRPCGDGIKPTCVLCPNLGGAMKCTPSGHKWAHVSCVLWIPEVSIGCAENMEPITKISSIPASRWSLVCVLCRERKGACIQCSVKTCKIAYHVTCAFKHGLEMRAIIEDENAEDGVKLRSYCQKHSVNSKKEKCPGSGSEEEEVKRKRRKDMTSEEKTQARAARLQEIEREFDKHVSVEDISSHPLDVDQDAIVYIYNYWKLKRRAGHNHPLLPPKSDDNELLTHKQEQADLDKMKMFVQLRQDLERVRNLCYMVSRREKLSRSFFRIREQTFHKQVAVLSGDQSLSTPELSAIMEANHGPSIYDRLYSHPDAPDHKNDFEEMLARIAPPDSGDEKKKDRNGLAKRSKSMNPYRKHYVNGSRRSGSMYSGLSSEESGTEIGRPTRYRKTIGSSTEEDVKKPSTSPKKKVSPKGKGKKSPKKTERKKKKVPQSKAIIDSSSEDESIKSKIKKERSRSKTLQDLEKEMTDGKFGQSGTDSDDLIPIRTTRNNKFPMNIYSDTSEDSVNDCKPEKSASKIKSEKEKQDISKIEKSPTETDSQQSFPRTKAAMKEFIQQPEKKAPVKEAEKPAPKKRGRKPSNKKTTPVKSMNSDDEAKNKENVKYSKQKDATDLIVPQRQAAKKASENMRSTTIAKKEEPTSDKQASGDDAKVKPKVKPSKGKEEKESPTKPGRKKSKDAGKETIAYVPQRQAAKKAAAHIKSGLGTKAPAVETSEVDKKKDGEKSEISKLSPKKDDAKYETKPKSPAKDSSSSSSNSSSSSYSSSSSSDEEPDKPEIKPTAKAREIKPVSRQPSLFSPQSARPTVDLPFLDKVSRPLSSTSASSDSESSKGSKYSGSSSPCIKRPKRRRRKEKPVSDTSSRKAPDKKLKTSERGSDCRESSPTTEREEPSGAADTASAATRARTRSITSGGNLPHKSDSGSRKPSRDEAGPSGSSKPAKESGQSSELPTSKRKTDEEIKRQPYPLFDSPKKDLKPKSTKIKQGDAVENKAISEEPVSVNRTSPRKSVDSKPKSLAHRRMSAKDTLQKSSDLSSDDKHEPYIKQRRMSRNDNSLSSDKKSSPLKKSSTLENTSLDIPVKKSPLANQIPITDNYSDNAQPWVPKPLSPHVHPPSVEKPCDLEKYITEDKSFDSDSADKSSSKMIAKIQAKLNENTMIKSPKTPIDATTTDPMDIDNPMARNIRKRSTTESEKKYNMQDTNQIPGVEISKSAKIPINLPQPKENEVFDFDMPVEEPFNHGDHIKPFPSIPVSFFKEDSKEQGAQETLDLVDRLRLQLTKKVSVEHPIQDELGINDDKHHKNDENDSLNYIPGSREHDIMGSQDLIADYNKKPTPKDMHSSLKHLQPGIDMLHSTDAMDDKDCQPIPMTSSDKWCMPQHNSHDHDLDRKYDHMPYEEVKEPSTVQSDMQSISEVGDTISISKQSDDSQSLSVIDNSIHSNDHDTQDNQNYDNNNSVIHSDCATISSPYGNRSKWSESKITTRRSSASSTNSEGSICSRKNDMKSQMNCDSHQGSLAQDIDPYPPMPSYSSRQMESTMPLNQYTDYPPDSPFMSAMSGLNLFSVGTSQLPLPSPGPGMYSGLPYSSAPLLPPLTPLLKPAFPTLCATFTSSSQNIALTTEMIAPQTPKPIDSPRDEIDVTGSDKFFPGVSSPSIMSVDSNNESSRAPTKMSNDSNDTISSLQHESKSPSKPAKLMTKFPGKSPGKSPGISPKQSESSKGSSKRPSNRSNRSHRGRGRSKSRVQPAYLLDYMDNNSIQSKLVGTVYDFNEELANDGVDLKALREKRKSIDVRDDRKSEHSYKDTSQSPRITSPLAVISKPPSAEPKETKPSTPGSPEKSPVSKSGLSFTQVQPVLPGPVDMRTYQPLESGAAAAAAAPPVFPSHLLAFASGTADQHLPDIDVEAERQLHSDLSANVPPEPALQTPEPPPPQLPKVSLTDPRNQLKVKIKGPFLDANYGSHHQPAVAAPFAPVPTLPPPAGSTNLRRMRKKELLRQYCSTQDMGELAGPSTFVAPIPFVPPPIPRAVIAIPKAVSSMTCIPTNRDDYYKDPPLEKKKRKPASGLSRELRHLKVSMNDDVEPYEMRPSAVTVNVSHKRRGRVPKKSKSTAATPVAPKLKIKIGSNVVQHVSEEPAGFQLRPPKKRIPHVLPTPSLEYLRQESMKYRRQVMADFEEEDEVPKKVKPSKSEKRKKKKDKKAEKEKLQVINSDSESATKLIIKIKRTDDGARAGGAGPAAAAAAAAPEPVVDPFEYDPSAPDPLADPPIRLKLSRAPAGSGYVMQEPPPAPPSGVR